MRYIHVAAEDLGLNLSYFHNELFIQREYKIDSSVNDLSDR